jgi:hypothetical protein
MDAGGCIYMLDQEDEGKLQVAKSKQRKLYILPAATIKHKQACG